jgi:hypothetical protein
MTKDEFLASIKNAIDDINDPESEFNAFIDEGVDQAREVQSHDRELSQKITVAVEAMKDLGAYIIAQGATLDTESLL